MNLQPHFWEYLLLVLKIIGIVGAFAGFSAEKKPEHTKKRAGRIAAFAFLSIAIGAELCDSFLKLKDANEQSERFERLTHPLGVIGVTPSYKIGLKWDSDFDDFRNHLGPLNDLAHVDKRKYPEVVALLKSTVSMSVSFRKKGNPDGEPDISFSFLLPRDIPRHDGKDFSYFTYIDGVYMANVEELLNDPNNRHSNGEIISTRDLLGSTLEIRFCPVVSLARPEDSKKLTDLIHLMEVKIDLPGREAFTVRTSRQDGVTSDQHPKNNSCSLLHYTFPETEDALRQMLDH